MRQNVKNISTKVLRGVGNTKKSKSLTIGKKPSYSYGREEWGLVWAKIDIMGVGQLVRHNK